MGETVEIWLISHGWSFNGAYFKGDQAVKICGIF